MLKEIINEKNISVSDSNICVRETDIKSGKINSLLVKNGIEVDSIYYKSQSLEDYFIKRVG